MNVPIRALQRFVALIVVVVVIGVVGWPALRDGGAEGSLSSDDPGLVTAPVERRVLESLLVTRGTVMSPAQATIVAGTPDEGELAVVVTNIPVARGEDVVAGGVAIEINGRPVFALPGQIPVYRDMRPGDIGPDVAAVQAAMAGMGYDVPQSERSAREFGYATQQAVKDLYERSGYEPAYTLGSREAVIAAEREATDMVDAAQAAVDAANSTGTGPAAVPPVDDGAAAGPDDDAEPQASVGATAVGSAQTALDDAKAARDRVHAAEGVMLRARELVAVRSLPASIVELPVRAGESVDPGTPVATIGSNEFRVRIELTSAQVNELAEDVEISVFSDRGYEATCPAADPRAADAAEEGESGGDGGADVDEPADDGGSGGVDGGASEVEKGADVGEAVEGAGVHGGSDEYVMDVVCEPLPPADSLGASLRVTMTVRRSDGEALVVPATAVTTSSSGGASVEVVGADGEPTRVEVTVGGEADGYVEVTPAGGAALDEGMDVRVRRS